MPGVHSLTATSSRPPGYPDMPVRLNAGLATAALLVVAMPGTTAAAGAPDRSGGWSVTATRLPPSSASRLVPSPAVGLEPDGLFAVAPGPGGTLVAWNRGVDDLPDASVLSVDARGRAGTEHRLPRPVETVARTAGGRGVALLDGPEYDRATNARKAPGLWAVAIGRTGTAGTLQRLSGGDTYAARLAVNANGDAAAVWIDWLGLRIKAATRRAGARFGPPVELARADPDDPTLGDVAVSVSRGGRVVVAYSSNVRGSSDRALAWVGTVRTRLGPMQRLGRVSVTRSETESGAAISAAFDGRERGYVAWGGTEARVAGELRQRRPVERGVRAGRHRRRRLATQPDRMVRAGAEIVGLHGGGAALAWTSPTGDARLTTITPSGQAGRAARYRRERVAALLRDDPARSSSRPSAATAQRLNSAPDGAAPHSLSSRAPNATPQRRHLELRRRRTTPGHAVSLNENAEPELLTATWRK